MADSKLVSIIGDSNVLRNMTGLNVASREVMKTAQIIDCTGAKTIEQSLHLVRAESNICIVAAITEQLLSGGFCGTIYGSVDPMLTSINAAISSYCINHPIIQVLCSFNF